MREYEFELRLCAHLEACRDAIVARQLGAGVVDGGGRVLDTVVIEPGPGFPDRSAITSRTIPPAAIASDVGVGRATRWPAGVDLPREVATRVRDRAIDVGFFEPVPERGSAYVRQTVRYPDWIGEITAIENKPDLGRPGALADQIQYDVSLGIVDRVVVATTSHVTGAHLHRLPEAVGVWEVSVTDTDCRIEVRRSAQRLDPAEWGIEIGDGTATRRQITPVAPTAKRTARVAVAERAYGKGWRPRFPSCRAVEPTAASGSTSIPYCTWKDRVIDPGECGQVCPGHDPCAPPAIDRVGDRAARTPWEPDPPGTARTQVGLDAFEDQQT